MNLAFCFKNEMKSIDTSSLVDKVEDSLVGIVEGT